MTDGGCMVVADRTGMCSESTGAELLGTRGLFLVPPRPYPEDYGLQVSTYSVSRKPRAAADEG